MESVNRISSAGFLFNGSSLLEAIVKYTSREISAIPVDSARLCNAISFSSRRSDTSSAIAVESFASKIMDALDFTGNDSESCENIVQIFDQNPTETDSLPDMWFLYNNGVLNTFSQITSFQTSEVEDDSEIKRSYSGIFLPTSSWDTQTYASENLLVLSGGGYRLANVTDEENVHSTVAEEQRAAEDGGEEGHLERREDGNNAD